MNRSLLPAFLLSAATLSVAARAQSVKYEKYTLPNGMTVILHEDHSLPTATINTWYRVGAQDEPPGRSGFAHLFEHLMFMGTARVPGNDFDVLMETGGGANNASTDLHRTNYFSWGPAKLLPTLLWLDADRLEDMGLNMTQDKLDKQRDVVCNELRQTTENAPYGKAAEMVWKIMYPPTHPYYNGVIGTHEDLEAANVVNVKDFFANYYVPNNASLVVAGDFNSAEIKPLIADLFGTLPTAPPVVRKYTPLKDTKAVQLDGEKRYTAIDKVQLPKVQFNYHSPRAFAEGDAEMALVAEVLTSGKSSRLYKRLVIDDKLASDVSAAQQSYPLGSIFAIDVLAKPDADLMRIEQIVDEEIARLIARGPTEEELNRIKAQIELGTLASLQNIRTKADKLNEYEYYLGEPDSFKADLDRYRNATSASVQRWAKEILTPNARGVIHVLPEEPTRAASPRDTRPGEGPTSPFTIPEPARFTLSCGTPVLLWQRTDLPLVAVSLVTRQDQWLDANGKGGLADLTAQMLREGAGTRDAIEFENTLQLLGATFRASAGPESAGASLTTLKRSFSQAVGLFADAIRNPRITETDWARVKALHLDELSQETDNPAAVAARVSRRVMFGDGVPQGAVGSGTVKSVQALTLADIKAAHAAMFDPKACTFLIAGDISPDEAQSVLNKAFDGWKAQPSTFSKADTKATGAGPLRIAIVDRPGAVQTMIRFLAPGFAFSDANRVHLELLNTLLGGSFTSRLNQNLREDHGYTYGARSGFEMGRDSGTFTAGAAVRADATGAALTEFFKEFDRLSKGDVAETDAQKVRETERNDTISAFAGLSGLTGTASQYILNGLPIDTTAKHLSTIDATTAAALNALAKDAFKVRQGVLVLVGDKGVILAQIKDLGLPAPVEYDAEGERVKN